MIQANSPRSWKEPIWHPDHGDAKAEFEQLRDLAEVVVLTIPWARVELLIPEPGLMLLRISGPGERLIEAYSVCETERKARRHALFLFPGTGQEEEVSANNLGEVLETLNDWNKIQVGTDV